MIFFNAIFSLKFDKLVKHASSMIKITVRIRDNKKNNEFLAESNNDQIK